MSKASTKHVYEGNDLESMSVAKNYYDWVAGEFAPYMRGTVVEVGAGIGTFSKYILARKPASFHAIEPSAEMAAVLKASLAGQKNVVATHGFLKSKRSELSGKADAAFYINVLEHIEKDREELKLIYETLKPGGHLCIYVPAVNALLGSFDEAVGHFRRYSKKELRQKLLSAGFEIERINYSDIAGILPWIVSFKIFKRRRLNSTAVQLYDKLVIPPTRIIERVIKPPIGKNLWAVAKKPD